MFALQDRLDLIYLHPAITLVSYSEAYAAAVYDSGPQPAGFLRCAAAIDQQWEGAGRCPQLLSV